MKWQIYPNVQINTTTGTAVQGIASCHQMDVLPTGAMADDSLWGQDTFKLHPYRACRGYVNVKRFNAGKNVNWLPVGTPGPIGGTLLRLLATGFADGQVMGKVVVTWYT